MIAKHNTSCSDSVDITHCNTNHTYLMLLDTNDIIGQLLMQLLQKVFS